jgi:hypothetical protein
MGTRHGNKLSYHMLLPKQYEGELEKAALKARMSVARYAAHLIQQHLDQLRQDATLEQSDSVAP